MYDWFSIKILNIHLNLNILYKFVNGLLYISKLVYPIKLVEGPSSIVKIRPFGNRIFIRI